MFPLKGVQAADVTNDEIEATEDELGQVGDQITQNQEEIEKIRELSQKTSKQELLDMLYALSTIENDIKWSTQKWILFQVGMIKLCSGQEKANQSNSKNDNSKIEILTQQVAKLTANEPIEPGDYPQNGRKCG